MFGSNNFKVLSFGLAAGITWGLCVFLLGIMSILWGWGEAAVNLVSSIYLGYGQTFGGVLLGTVWACVDGFIGGVFFSWLYNRLQKTVKE